MLIRFIEFIELIFISLVLIRIDILNKFFINYFARIIIRIALIF